MRLLLDTHVVLWWLADDTRLGNVARTAIAGAPEVAVSAVTAWEINLKSALGKLEAPDDLRQQLAGSGMRELPISFAHAEELRSLPAHHRDPFDRMLIAQARSEAMTLVSADGHFTMYDVKLLDARLG